MRRNTVAVILGGGRGERLLPLTAERAKPAVPFAGAYRLIDIPISNCLSAGIDEIFVLTQYRSVSLNRHIASTYRFDAFRKGHVTVLAAEQSDGSGGRGGWYEGTADAVRKHLDRYSAGQSGDVVVLSGDQVYMMDLDALVSSHRAAGADVTVAATRIRADDVPRFGVLAVDEAMRITDFAEKPREADVIERLAVPRPDGDRTHLGSMGIYVFRAPVLRELLERGLSDFGRHVVPQAIAEQRTFAYPFEGYWEDVGTIESYHRVHMELVAPVPPLNLYDVDHPLYTHPRFLAPTKLGRAAIDACLLSGGSIVGDGARLRSTVLGVRAVVGTGCELDEVVVNGAATYDFRQARGATPPLGIGRDSRLRRVIIDRDARIGEGVVLTNEAAHVDYQDEVVTVRDGVIVIPSGGVVPDGYRL